MADIVSNTGFHEMSASDFADYHTQYIGEIEQLGIKQPLLIEHRRRRPLRHKEEPITLCVAAYSCPRHYYQRCQSNRHYYLFEGNASSTTYRATLGCFYLSPCPVGVKNVPYFEASNYKQPMSRWHQSTADKNIIIADY